MTSSKSHEFLRGFRFGISIALGYFAVAFSLGITAQKAGLSAFQAALTSFLVSASAGEYAAFTQMAIGAGIGTVAIMELVANARYLLMSCSLSQKLSSETKLRHRLLIGLAVTDEMFGVSMGQADSVSPYFYFGMMSIAMTGWTTGTWLGVAVGNILPAILVSALAVSLYGMFIAIVVPAAKKDRSVLEFVLISMAASWLCTVLPYIREISSGVVTIILTVFLSAIAAVVCPIKDKDGEVTDEP